MPYDEEADAEALIGAAREQALAEGKFLMVTFGANWCLDCRMLHHNLTTEPVASYTQATLNDAIQLRDGRIVLAGLAGTLLVSEDQGRNFALHAQADRAGIARVLQAEDGALILIGEMGVRRLALAELSGEVAQ